MAYQIEITEAEHSNGLVRTAGTLDGEPFDILIPESELAGPRTAEDRRQLIGRAVLARRPSPFSDLVGTAELLTPTEEAARRSVENEAAIARRQQEQEKSV